MTGVAAHDQDLSNQIEIAFEQLTKLRADWKNGSVQLVVGCYASCVELAQTVDFLVDHEKCYDAQIILRSMLEHFVELRNLELNPAHKNNLHFTHAKNVKFQLQNAATENKFFQNFAQRLELAKETQYWNDKLGDIQELGGENLNIQRRFQIAGMNDEYESVYRNLSQLSHPTYGGIIRRHLNYHSDTHKCIILGT